MMEIMSGDSTYVEQTGVIKRTTDRRNALRNANEFLADLPHAKARAIIRALNYFKNNGQSSYFGLYDLLPQNYFKERHPAGLGEKTESPALMMRKKIIEANQQDYNRIGIDRPERKDLIHSYRSDIQDSDSKDRFTLRDMDNLFDKNGAINLPLDRLQREEDIINSTGNESSAVALQRLKAFYNIKRRFGDFDASEGTVDLRGLDYIVCCNSKKDLFDKVETINNTVSDGLNLIKEVDRGDINQSSEFLLYLGVLDYLKMHSTVIFHALTTDERLLHVPEGNDGVWYKYYRSHAKKIMETTTRMYYQALLGLKYDKGLDMDEMHESFQDLTRYTRYIIGKDEFGDKFVDDKQSMKTVKNYDQSTVNICKTRFKTPDVQHPLILALGAQEAVMKYPDADFIVGVPSGGTEVAVVTQLLYEKIRNKPLELDYIPISIHSGIHVEDNAVIDYIQKVYKDKFKAKRVLVTDDNASGGGILGKVISGLKHNGAEEIFTHVIEFDANKFLKPEFMSDMYRLDDLPSTSMGLTELDNQGGYVKPQDDRIKLGQLNEFARRSGSQERKKMFTSQKR